MWRKTDNIGDGAPRAVGDLRERLVPYITGSRRLLERYGDEIAAKLNGRKQVAVRCLGYRAWTLLGDTILRGLDVVAYIDNSPAKQGLTVRGVRVVGPQVPIATGVPIIVLAYHVETAVVDEYAVSDPQREVASRSAGRGRALASG
jgi:hypothetical protein